MKKINLLLSVCMVMHSWVYNAALAGQTTYTDYGVKTEAELNSALTKDDGNTERIHIMSNINLQNNLSTPANPNGMVILGEGSNITIDAGGVEGRAFVGRTIDNLTFTNFKIHPGTWGGVMSNWSGVQNIYNSTFTSNTGSGSNTNGAALVNANSGATMNIYNSHFTKNTVTDRGGAIYNDDNGVVNIFHSTFGEALDVTSGNTAQKGGAIHNESGYTNGSILQISDSTFNSNIANDSGGAISNHFATTNIFNSEFNSNRANSGGGGAIYNDYGTTNIFNSKFNSNTALSKGGAIYNSQGSILQISDSTFNSNIANDSGGAIYNEGTGNTYIISNWKNVTFSGNQSNSGFGGAICNEGDLYLTANTSGMNFSGNTGGDLYNYGITHLNAGIADMTFGSGIISPSGNAIYINKSGVDADINNDGVLETAPTTGRIILNSALTGTGNVEVDGGTLKVGTAGSIGASGAGNAIGALTLSGNSVLNLADGTIKQNNIYIDSLTTASNTSSIWMDANLSLGTKAEDTINVGNYHMTAKPNFVFRILGDDTNPAAMGVIAPLSGAGDFFNATVKSIAYTNHYKYDFTGNTSNFFGFLDYDRTGDGTTYDGLKGAINDTSAFRSFSLVRTDYTATSNLDSNAITNTLTIFGTGNSGLAISGDNQYRLFNVASGGTLNLVEAVLKNAKTTGNGAAINNDGTLNVYDSFLTGNQSNSDGGVIYNNGNTYISGSTFTKNSTDNYGGAISNEYGKTIAIYNSVFGGSDSDANTANTGGAVNNAGTAYISDSIFSYNKAYGNGGGAINNEDTLSIYNSNFNNNFAEWSGGAIINNSSLSIYNSTFKNNNANDAGGALWLTGNVSNIYNSTFGGSVGEGNTAQKGGAIFLGGSYGFTPTVNLIANGGNLTFENNRASDTGGAIYSICGTVNMIANNGNITFTGNTATNGGNDIYLEKDIYTSTNSSLNLNSAQGSKISFDGGIKSSAIEAGTVNINQTGTVTLDGQNMSLPTTGEVVLNAPIETSTVNLYGGALTLGHDNYLDGNALTLAGGTLNMQNGATGTMAVNSLAVAGATNLKIDADLTAGKSDTITGTYSASTSKMNVSSIKLLNDSTAAATTQLLDGGLVGHNLISLGTTKAYTPIYQYDVSYNDATGKLAFNGGGSGGGSGGFNPSILSSPVSANVGAYMNQVAVYNEALGRAELFMSLPQSERVLMRYNNKYANVGGNDVQPEVFSPLFTPSERGGIWFKQYTSFENVPLNNGPNVSNVGYGAMVGADSPMYHLKNGYDGYVTAYVGYNGSHQNYDNVGVYQNGGALGLTGTLYKGNFFTALTASVGESIGQANTMYGTDNFNTLLAGLAWKTGYNIEMAQGKFILQPSLLAAYTFANTFDYTTASGVSMTSNPMNAVQIAPGVKLIANMKNGWQPYLAANMVFNIMDTQKFQANDVQLPQMSIAPYFEYGLGVQRRWGERLTGFGQAMLRGGGRNGVGLQFGFRLAVGK